MTGVEAMKSAKHIFLIGFSGSGKSTLGRILASRLGLMFVDLDSVIEKNLDRTIAEIFDGSGEATFRCYEKKHLEAVLRSRQRLVIALGGGAFESAAIRTMAYRHGTTVYLSCSQRELNRRLRPVGDRPLLRVNCRRGESRTQTRERRIRSLLKKRLANYRSADLIVSTTGKSPKKSAGELIQLLRKIA